MNETMKIIFGLVGGLSIFIYGMNMMSECLQKAAGEKMKTILSMLTKNPILGVLAGAITTAVLQSSSATTVMAIGFVSAGLMTLPQAISIILGANIGTTMTAQIIAFKISDYIYLFIFVGFVIYFIAKKQKVKNIGQTIFAFGLLFLGIETMGDVMKPLASSAFFVDMIGKVSHIPILGVGVGALMTLVVQSSSATIAVLQNFASQAGPDGVTSIIGLTGAIPILLGDNIGTTITAVIASIGQPKDARRTAFAHCIFNISGAILFLFLVKPYAALIQYISPKGNEVDVISRQIANAHTGFNITMTLIWIPLIPVMVKIVMMLVPDKKGTEQIALEQPLYLDNRLIGQPAAALSLVAKEIFRCAKIVEAMLDKVTDLNTKDGKDTVSYINENAGALKKLYTTINDYLASMYSGGVMAEEQAAQSAELLYVLCDVDRIGSLVYDIANTVDDEKSEKHKFSKEAMKELKKSMEQIRKIYSCSINAIAGTQALDMKDLQAQKESVMKLNESMRKNHIARIGKGKCDSKLTAPFNEIIHNIDRIGNSCLNLAEAASENVTVRTFFEMDNDELKEVQIA
ncbi:Na/Pi cotransporter family protein [Agathobacter sp.]